jgi:hypothetical protein
MTLEFVTPLIVLPRCPTPPDVDSQLLAGDSYNPSWSSCRSIPCSILRPSPTDQPYTKYLCIYFLGILVASVHLMVVIRQDRF